MKLKVFLNERIGKKHLLVKEQQPNLDIRFVFGNSKNKIYKGSKTSYADWCNKNGFMFADKIIPNEWVMKMLVKKTAKEYQIIINQR